MSREAEALAEVYGHWGELAARLPELAAEPTRCTGWRTAELAFHLLLDAQRCLVTLASPADRGPDRDAVSYWADFSGEGARDRSEDAHTRFVQRAAAAFDPPRWLGTLLGDTLAAAVRAARLAPDDVVTTQGHVLTTADFLSTLVLEAVVHGQDLADPLTLEGPSWQVAAPVLAALAGADGPAAGIAPGRWVLLCGGRDRATAAELAALAASVRLPALG